MMEYEFTLKFSLGNKNINPEDYIEKLENQGCTDALIGVGKNGRIALNFIREAESAYDALFSAISDVKKAIPDAKLIEATPDFVGLTDIADILGFTRQNMRKIMENNIDEFPLPIHEGSSSIWNLFNILDWIKKKNLYEVKNSLLDISKTNMIININKRNADFDFSLPKKASLLLN